MATVKIFDRSMIINYLKQKDWNFLRTQSDNFLVNFEYDEDLGCEACLLFGVEGDKENIYSVSVVSRKQIPKSQWGEVLMLCNTWNKTHRYPKVYLSIDDINTDTTANVVTEEYIDLGVGVHQELLDDYTNTVIGSSVQFLKWMHKEKGF